MFVFKAHLWLDSFHFTIFLKLQMSCPTLGNIGARKMPRRERELPCGPERVLLGEVGGEGTYAAYCSARSRDWFEGGNGSFSPALAVCQLIPLSGGTVSYHRS